MTDEASPAPAPAPPPVPLAHAAPPPPPLAALPEPSRGAVYDLDEFSDEEAPAAAKRPRVAQVQGGQAALPPTGQGAGAGAAGPARGGGRRSAKGFAPAPSDLSFSPSPERPQQAPPSRRPRSLLRPGADADLAAEAQHFRQSKRWCHGEDEAERRQFRADGAGDSGPDLARSPIAWRGLQQPAAQGEESGGVTERRRRVRFAPEPTIIEIEARPERPVMTPVRPLEPFPPWVPCAVMGLAKFACNGTSRLRYMPSHFLSHP